MAEVDARVEIIVRAIRRYIELHPEAADSAEGILRWWLMPEEHAESIHAVERALELLAVGGHLRKVRHESGRVLYAAARKPARHE